MMIITIDGPSGTGKSTVAQALADKIGFTYFDTGAMYRAFTYLALQRKIDAEDEAAIQALLKEFDYQIHPMGQQKHYFIGQENVTLSLREPAVTEYVSTIAAIPEVRYQLVEIQKAYGQQVNAVFEGRDLGTVVFPEAEIKIFLTALPEVRAKRRYDELVVKFPELKGKLSLEDLTEQICQRDEKDSTRKVSPLKRAKDAHLIDTSNMGIGDVIEAILDYKSLSGKK